MSTKDMRMESVNITHIAFYTLTRSVTNQQINQMFSTVCAILRRQISFGYRVHS